VELCILDDIQLDIYVLIKLWIYAFSDLLLRIDDWRRKRDEHTIVLRRELTTLFLFFSSLVFEDQFGRVATARHARDPSMPRRDAPLMHLRTTRSGSTQRASSRDPGA
jgi:hypothetical protein